MGHRQDMTPEQRLKWDCDNYKKRLDASKGSNYEYWTEKHDRLLENGWDLASFRDIEQAIEIYTRYESTAKNKVLELRASNNYARIICTANRLRVKTYSVIFKSKAKNK